jgi:iron complex outermembrane recepter protein
MKDHRMRHLTFVASLLAGVAPSAFAQSPPKPDVTLAAPAPAGRDVVVITASPLEGDPDRFATIVENVTRDDILEKGGANLADALKDVPGVSGTGFAAGASRPVIRGMDANRVKLLEDGVSSSDVSDVGPDHGVPIDPLSAQSIEVVRGAATLRYGSQAIGGVVNAINNRVPMTLPDKPLSGEVSGSYASAAKTSQGSILLDGAANQFAWHADAFGRRSSNYDTPDGTQENSFFKGDGYSAGGSYFFDKDTHIGLSGIHYDARYGIPSDTTFIDMKQDKVLSKSSLGLGDGVFKKLNVDAGYADYQHSEIDPSTGAVLSTFLNKEWDGRAEALLGKVGVLSASALGVQVGDRKFQALGDGGDYLFPTHTQSAAGFVFTEAPLGDTAHLQAAARVERVEVEGTPASNVLTKREFTPVSGSVGVLFDVSDSVKLGATLASAARAPGQVELFARGAHDGPATFETGDPTLDIERSTSIEGTVRVRVPAFRLEGAIWGSRFNNYIFGRLTGRTCDSAGVCVVGDAQDLKELFYQQQDATFYGAEGKLTADLVETSGGTLQLEGLADYVHAELSKGGGPVPRIQPYRIGGGLNWASDELDAGFLFLYVGKRDDVAVAETPTKGFVSLDAQVAWRPMLDSNKGLTILLVAHNLTDDVQRNAVALNKDDVILPGRDVSLVLRQTF